MNVDPYYQQQEYRSMTLLPMRMTLNDLECPIHLKVRLVEGKLDVSLLRVSDSTICIGVVRIGIVG